MNLKSKVDENMDFFGGFAVRVVWLLCAAALIVFSHRALRERRCEGREDRK